MSNPFSHIAHHKVAHDTGPLLIVAEVALRLRVCERTVRRWIEGGQMPAHRLNRTIRVSVIDLQAFLARSR